MKKISTIPFQGSKEQEDELLAAIEQYRPQKGALMPILQKAQEIYGYLPYEVQRIIAGEMSVSMEEIFGVATFYSQFSLAPKGKYQVSVCMGTACYVKGSGEILEKICKKLGIENGECSADGKFSLEACRCIGACGLAPVVTVNEEVYGKLGVNDVDAVLEKYI